VRVRLDRPSAQIATLVADVLGALPICAPLALIGCPAARAQAVEPTTLATDIPAQPLTEALAAFAQQTGLQLVYVSGIVRNQKSHAVSAGLNAQQGLTRLLQGTGLRFEYLTPHSIRILSSAPSPKTTKKVATDDEPDEIIVTANRRREAVQNVPITIQVLTNAALSKLNATTFDDFVSYLPGVTAHGVGPAQNSIYVRGLGTGEYANQAAGTNGSFPNVAVYLDEQSAQLPGRNLDIYTADLDRIEVLEGPQGTLFGAGAQAGVLRYITNKPRLNVTEATMKAAYAITAHGDPSTALEAVLNLPVISDKLAVRAVIYNEKRGGYIDNTPAIFARDDADRSIRYANYPTGCDPFGTPACRVPPNSVVINNSAQVAKNINTVTYQGTRVEALYQVNEDWTALLAQSYQNIEVDGVFAEMAANSLGEPQPDLTVQLFNPSYNKDRFENTALTLDGHLRALELLYAGSYFVRNVEQVQDYTNYARGGVYVDYYQCVNPSQTSTTAQCFTPSSTWRDRERNTHQSHELRLSTPDNWRIRGIGGLFYDKYAIHDEGDWFYLTALPYFNPVGPPTGYWALNGHPVCACTPDAVIVPGGVTSNNPNVRPLGDGFFNDVTRGYNQKAVYGSLDVELIPRTLTLTAGTRYFSTNTTEVGSLVGSFGCGQLPTNSFPGPVPNPCLNHSDFTNLNALGLNRTYSGFRSRASLSWRLSEDATLYYTWSQGFRSGGFNRSLTFPGYSPLYPGTFDWQEQARRHGGWTPSLAFAPDNLTNNEVGWKTSWLDQRLHWSGAVYQENWDHAQIGAFDADVIGNAVINGGNYRVRGAETSVVSRITSGLSIEISAAWNHSELVKEASFFWADGTPIDFRSLQTYAGQKLANPAGTVGSPLAGAPPFQSSLRARYEVALGSYGAFVQVGAVHQSHSLATTDRLGLTLQGSFVGYDLPPFTAYDGALGVGHDAWLAQLYGENLTDTRAQLYASNSLNYHSTTVNRPRTIGLRVSYKFSGNAEPDS
jgi:outer membrane receptor protein involved in Fe transport